ncbi:MAG: response regulator [Chloroflexi bacterium]|nr:response regulator [Chloroflexota bacterium]
MEQKEFNSLFRDLITHLYDYTVLETHPLTSVITPPQDYRESRGEFIRKLILDEIVRFKPEGEESLHAIDWRPYHILHNRYVEGISLRELSQMLSLSERQLRRDNSRTLKALTGRIWDKLFSESGEILVDENAVEDQAFVSDFEVLDLNTIITEIEEMLQKRVTADGFELITDLARGSIQIMADRIVTRQILISLVGYFINFPCAPTINLQTGIEEEHALVVLRSKLVETWCRDEELDHADFLESTRYWSAQMGGEITIKHPPDGKMGDIELIFSLPFSQNNIILVVDDQQPTQQLFRRFMNRTAYRVIGTTDPGEAITMARQLKPKLITLDVMMPKVDGWEILQAFKTDLETKNIPILVCSAWAEPELAHSLGAAGFLKKPIRQRDFLTELDRLNLLLLDK